MASTHLPQANPEPNGNTKKAIRFRSWAFTWNNYDPAWKDILTQKFSVYLGNQYVMQEEQGSNGTPHIQGVVTFKNQVALFDFFKNLGIHCEKTRNINASNAYCMKSETRIGEVVTNIEKIIDPLLNCTLKPWQSDIFDIINSPRDNRKIYWYYDKLGGAGKTSLARHICLSKKFCLYLSGKSKDVKYAIAAFIEEFGRIDAVFYNITRSNENYISYEAIESIKDGILFSSKYESKMLIFNWPHVIVFGNSEPDYVKLSEDRWIVRDIGE